MTADALHDALYDVLRDVPRDVLHDAATRGRLRPIALAELDRGPRRAPTSIRSNRESSA